MTQAVATTNGTHAIAPAGTFTREQVDLIKKTVAEGTSDNELALFLEVCKSSGLNPFQRQIYAVMRSVNTKDARGNWVNEKRMVIQTGIDGYRLIAARSGVHAGTSDAEYGAENKAGYPAWARVTVRKLMPGGHIADFTATARWEEYCQTTKDGKPSGQWPKMPYLMLGKCAEALALRKAFPAELSGVYTAEEMSQADTPAPEATAPSSPPPSTKPTAITTEQIEIIGKEMERVGWTLNEGAAYLQKTYKKKSRRELTGEQAAALIQFLQALEAAPKAVTVEAEVVTEAPPKYTEADTQATYEITGTGDPMLDAIKGATPLDQGEV